MGRSEGLPVFNSVLERRDLNFAEKWLLSALIFWQNDKDCSWWKQKDMAAVLGMPLRTVRRTIASLKAKGLIQIGGGRYFSNHRNCYRVTNSGMPESGPFRPHCKPADTANAGKTAGKIRVFSSKINRPESTHLDKIQARAISLNAPSAGFSPGNLSRLPPIRGPDSDRVCLRMVSDGVRRAMAEQLAFRDRIPYESWDQAFSNGRILAAFQSESAGLDVVAFGRFNLAGYAIQAVRGARREGKIVKATRLFRAARARAQAFRQARTRAAERPALGADEIERRRRAQKQALLSLPANRRAPAPGRSPPAVQVPTRRLKNADLSLSQAVRQVQTRLAAGLPADIAEDEKRRRAQKRALGLPA